MVSWPLAMEWPSLGLGPRPLEVVREAVRRLPATSFEPAEAASPSAALLSSGKTLLEGLVLGLPRSIDEKPAK
jgi:hypothetical protein